VTNPGNSKSLFLTLLISGGALAYAFLIFVPIQRSIASLRSELDSKRQFILDAGSLEPRITELTAELQQAEKVVDSWREHSPSEEEMATFIGQVSVLASKAGAKPGRITPREAITLASLRRHPAEFSVQGSFSQLSHFLAELESLPKTIWINDLKLQRDGEDRETLRGEITFSVFADNSGKSD